MFEVVHALTDWYDGPRKGIADYDACPHAFASEFDEIVDEYAGTFLLKPLDATTFEMAMEDWAIWRRWEIAFHRKETTIDTHPALPEDRDRHLELKKLLDDRLLIESTALRKTPEFRNRVGSDWSGVGLPELEVRWHNPTAS